MPLVSPLSRASAPGSGPAFPAPREAVKALAKGASQNKERTMENTQFKVSLITDGKWSYVGNAYFNTNVSQCTSMQKMILFG
jgi:hypothetical protein